MMVCAYNPGYLGSGGRNIESSRPAQAKLERPYFKNEIQIKGLGRGPSGRACMGALHSIPSTKVQLRYGGISCACVHGCTEGYLFHGSSRKLPCS
jgi:hypothetical protein